MGNHIIDFIGTQCRHPVDPSINGVREARAGEVQPRREAPADARSVGRSPEWRNRESNSLTPTRSCRQARDNVIGSIVERVDRIEVLPLEIAGNKNNERSGNPDANRRD